MQNKPLILVTNDDGIEARGFLALLELAREFGNVVAISSQVPMSGMSHENRVFMAINGEEFVEHTYASR